MNDGIVPMENADVQSLIVELEEFGVDQSAPVFVLDSRGMWKRVSKIEFWGGLILID